MLTNHCILTRLMLFASITTALFLPTPTPFGAVLLHAQQSTLPTDTTTINRLNALAESYAAQGDDVKDTAFFYAKRAFSLAERIGYKRGMAEALATLAYRYNLDGKIEQGLEFGFKQLQLAEELGDKRLIARGLISIGFAAGQQSRADSAAIWDARARLLKALAISSELRDSLLITFCYNSLGRLSRMAGEQQSAQQYHEKALAIGEKLASLEQTSWALHSLAALDESQQRYTIALQRAVRSLALREQSKRTFAIATSLRLVGHIHLKMRNFSAAKRFAERSIGMSKSLDGLFLVKMQSYQLLADANTALKQPTEALSAFKSYTAIKDSAAAIEAKNNILQLQAHIDRERKDHEQSLLAREGALQKAVIERQYALGIFVIGCALLLSILVVILWRNNHHKKQQNEELSSAYREIRQQQEILESQAQEIELTNTQLQEINETLQASNIALDEANTFKLNMLSIAAHDLKNPLHTIANFAELLQEDASPNENSRTNEFAGRIVRICQRMLTLIHDLLETAAHDLGKMTLQNEPVNLSDLAIAVTEQYATQAQEKDQTIIVENQEECWVEGDVQRLYQVLDNLVSNAIKYSPFGKRIWLTLSIPANQGITRLSVKDEGPGMSDDDKSKAFVMFQRLSAEATGGESSTGIGLALVKQIVELHGGTISIVSEFGHGAEFIVELPCWAKL